MKKIFYTIFIIIMFASLKPKHINTVYTYDATQANVNIDNTTFGTPLVAGDVVNIPKRTTGSGTYDNFNLTGLQCGISAPDTLNSNHWIHIVFASDAWMSVQVSDPVSSFEDGNKGLHIYGYKAYKHSTMFRHGGFGTILGYSHYMWIDSFKLINSASMTSGATGTHTAFGGNVANSYSHWYYTNGFIDTSAGLDASVGIYLGSISTQGVYLNAVVRNCIFDHFYSPSLASQFINAENAWGTEIYHNTFSNLGMVANPGGHAALIASTLGNGTVHDNFFGPNNFGNELRVRGSDLDISGYRGRWTYYNNISTDKRKYPLVENQDVSGGDLTTMAPYARARSGPETWNNMVCNIAIGNPPYLAYLYDSYTNDTVTVNNNYMVMVRDTTWNRVGVVTVTFGTPSRFDTSHNYTFQFWPDAGIQDSVHYVPVQGGAIYQKGTTVPAYITSDYYGRALNSPPSVGPVQWYDPNTHNFWQGNYKIKIRGG